jgi:hypothetical protein
MPRKSADVAAELNISDMRLLYLVRAKKIPRPPKDSSGDYIWDDALVEAARQALKIDRRRKAVAPG